jgi:hypothetical protein
MQMDTSRRGRGKTVGYEYEALCLPWVCLWGHVFPNQTELVQARSYLPDTHYPIENSLVDEGWH